MNIISINVEHYAQEIETILPHKNGRITPHQMRPFTLLLNENIQVQNSTELH